MWAVRWILLGLICGYSSQGIAANLTQRDSFVTTILCHKSLFCRSFTGLRVLWHFNQLLSLHSPFSALRAKWVSSRIAQGERSLLLRQLTRPAVGLNALATHSMGSSEEIGAEPKTAWKIFQGNSSMFCLSLLAFLQIICKHTVSSMLSNLRARIAEKTYFQHEI